MGATFSRLKNWTAEILTYSDLNQEIDNILTNLTPSGMDDYSANTAQMQIMTDPGEVGSESLATSLAGELARIRFVLKELKGTGVDEWYESSATSLTDIGLVIGTGLPGNRIISTKTSANSSQPIALIPAGSSAALTLDATSTPFIYYVNGVRYEQETDITISGLLPAPSSNNTAVINMAILNSGTGSLDYEHSSNWLGQFNTKIAVDAVGSEIQALAGKLAAFKVTGKDTSQSAATEYFLATVDPTTFALSRIQRGFFFNSSSNPVKSVSLEDDLVVTLLKLTWIFLTTSGTLLVTYNPPTTSTTAPTSPTVGDYWFDLANNTWKTWNSVTWVASNAILIGVSVQDTSNCIGARTFDTFKNLTGDNNITLDRVSTTVMSVYNASSYVDVYGTPVRYNYSKPTWTLTSSLESGAVIPNVNSDGYAFFYVKESGETVISDRCPYNRYDLNGYYHPHETWRCVGFIHADSATTFEAIDATSFRDQYDRHMLIGSKRMALDSVGLGTGVISTSDQNHIVLSWSNFYVMKYSQATTTVNGSSGNWSELVSSNTTRLLLEPGMWLVSGSYILTSVGSLTATLVEIFVGINSGATAPGIDHFQNWVSTTSGETITMAVQPYLIALDVTTSIRMYSKIGTLDSDMRFAGWSIKALRIDSLNNAKGL